MVLNSGGKVWCALEGTGLRRLGSVRYVRSEANNRLAASSNEFGSGAEYCWATSFACPNEHPSRPWMSFYGLLPL